MHSLDANAHPNERAIAALIAGKGEEVVFFTREGMAKRSSLSDTLTTKIFYQAVKINDGDTLIGVQYVTKGSSVLMLSEGGMSLTFDVSEIPLQGRVSAGVRGINLDEGDKVVFAGLFSNGDSAVVATLKGNIKKLDCASFGKGSRYRKGLRYIVLKQDDKVTFGCLSSSAPVIAVDFGLKILPLDTKKFKPQERLTQGDEVIKKQFLGIYKFC